MTRGVVQNFCSGLPYRGLHSKAVSSHRRVGLRTLELIAPFKVNKVKAEILILDPLTAMHRINRKREFLSLEEL